MYKNMKLQIIVSTTQTRKRIEKLKEIKIDDKIEF